MGERGQHPIGSISFSDYFWSEKQPICSLHSSVPSAICPPEYRSAIKRGNIRASFCVSRERTFSLLCGVNVFGLFSLIVGSAEMGFALRLVQLV